MAFKILGRTLRNYNNAGLNLQILTHRYLSTSLIAATSNENPVLEDYLVESIEFSRDVANSISTKFTPIKSTKKPKQVVDYLQTSGFSKSQIRKLVSFHPRILFNNVEKTLKPKIRVFESLGLPGSNIRSALSSDPWVLQRSLTQIVPALQVVKSLITVPENAFRVVLRSQQFLSLNNRSRRFFAQNLALLKSYGVPMTSVEKLTVHGNTFLWTNTKRLEKVLRRVEEEIRIPRKSPMFMHGVCVFTSMSEEKINAKLELYKSFGWSEEDFFQMVRRLPYALGMSEDTMRFRLKYFMEELGYESAYLASHPVLLLLSTEKRVKPRNHVLKLLKQKKLLNMGLYTFVLVKEADFVKKYVKPFDKDVPGLYSTYVAMTKGRSVTGDV